VAVVPAHVARMGALTRAIDSHEPPLPVAPVEISLFWHESTRHNALHQMVRQQLLDHFAPQRERVPAA
jgi:DNA-binding transcriptional LysR family regulator